MELVALVILILCGAAVRFDKIESAYGKNNILLLVHHQIIAFAALGSAGFIGTSNIVFLTFSIVSAIAALFHWNICNYMQVARAK